MPPTSPDTAFDLTSAVHMASAGARDLASLFLRTQAMRSETISAPKAGAIRYLTTIATEISMDKVRAMCSQTRCAPVAGPSLAVANSNHVTPNHVTRQLLSSSACSCRPAHRRMQRN